MTQKSFEGSPHHKMAPMRLAPQDTHAQCPEAGPMLGIRVEHPHGNLPAAATLTLVLKSPPTQPQERLEGFTYLS